MKRIGMFCCAALMAGQAVAVDGVMMQYGTGYSTDIARVGLVWDWDRQWFDSGDWVLTGHWAAEVGRWTARDNATADRSFTEVGITPVFRYQRQSTEGVAPYVEGAIGVHVIAPVFHNGVRRFSTGFQFGDHLGIGARFGAHQQFDLAYRFQHLSNADIKQPNPGVNIRQINFIYRF